jgi:DNA primase
MARIPENELERLKNEVSVERLVEASGISLKKSGKDLLGQCPFHDDGEPSLVVTPAKNLWHCFGCGSGGNPIDWVMKAQGISFRHAVELLREGLATENNPSLAANGDKTAKPAKRSTVPKLPAPIALDADGQALLNQVIGYYHDTLKASPEAYAYLESRGFAGEPLALAIVTFKLGYANRTLGLRLPEKNRVAGNAIRARLQDIGIVRESGHEHFNGSLVIPIFDESGNVVEVYGRKVRDDLRAGTPKHLYLPGQHKGIWNIQTLSSAKEIILCEALVDALTFWCAGYKNVTSCYGIEGFTDEMPALFKQHNINRILLAFDRDEAGERGTAKVAEKLMAIGIDCFRIRFPSGMDANSFALSEGKAASQSLGKLIRGAHWLGQGKVPSLPETVAENALVTSDNPRLAAKEGEDLTSLSTAAAEPSPDPLPASPMPDMAQDLPIEIAATGSCPLAALPRPWGAKNNEIWLTLGDGKQQRRYRVRGLTKNLAVDVLKVNLLVSVGHSDENVFYVDTLDLYSAKQRSHYITQAAQETRLDEKLLKSDLGRVLLALEQCQDNNIADTLKPEPVPDMPEAEHATALELLKSPNLIDRILADFGACGLVGEDTNKLIAYLAAVSRKLANPLAIVVQSTSAAGKSALMDAVLAFMPDDEKVKYSAMTGQSLFYMGETSLKHKILAISEEEGVARAGYALKLLQSEGELTMASTGKDPATGNLVTQGYKVEGPVMIFLTTTAIDLDEELLNRCIVLSVDEGRGQTEAIHHLQRHKRTLDGLQARQEKQRLAKLHQNAQRLLKPLAVVNPYADQLTFLSDKTRTRRDHEKYLTLIDTLALLHQHQRPVKTLANNYPADGGNAALEYIEVTLADIIAANALAHEALGRCLNELPPQTRNLLAQLVGHINAHCQTQAVRRCDARLSRKDIRALTGWGDTQLRVHLERLVQMEYLLAHRDGSGGRYVYELLYDGDAGQPLHLSGLIDPGQLQKDHQANPTMPKSRGDNPELAGRLRDGCAPVAATLQPDQNGAKPSTMQHPGILSVTDAKTHILATNGKTVSYPKQTAVTLSLSATGN